MESLIKKKIWPFITRAWWARVLFMIPESIKLGYHSILATYFITISKLTLSMDSRTKRRIYFSSPKIIFITPFRILIFKKAFKKKKKKIERLIYLGRKPGPERGQISHCTRILQHFSVNHCRWSVARWEGLPSEKAVVVAIRLHQTRPRELGMFSTFPLFILA